MSSTTTFKQHPKSITFALGRSIYKMGPSHNAASLSVVQKSFRNMWKRITSVSENRITFAIGLSVNAMAFLFISVKKCNDIYVHIRTTGPTYAHFANGDLPRGLPSNSMNVFIPESDHTR
jgi:hypothetical protein